MKIDRRLAGLVLGGVGFQFILNIPLVHRVPNVAYLTVGSLSSTLPATVGFVMLYLGIMSLFCGWSLFRHGTFFPPEASHQ